MHFGSQDNALHLVQPFRQFALTNDRLRSIHLSTDWLTADMMEQFETEANRVNFLSRITLARLVMFSNQAPQLPPIRGYTDYLSLATSLTSLSLQLPNENQQFSYNQLVTAISNLHHLRALQIYSIGMDNLTFDRIRGNLPQVPSVTQLSLNFSLNSHEFQLNNLEIDNVFQNLVSLTLDIAIYGCPTCGYVYNDDASEEEEERVVEHFPLDRAKECARRLLASIRDWNARHFANGSVTWPQRYVEIFSLEDILQ